jgi:CobQ-like glutamine amidotransferase family enzyme
VPKVIKFAAISPTHLNLNGDLGNLLVLQKRLAWRNVKSSITELSESDSLAGFDYVFVGHGSPAAWSQLLSLNPRFLEDVASYINNGGALLAVASAADHLQKLLSGELVSRGEWQSRFVEQDEVVGYLNTDSKSDYLVWHRNALLTQLHGPIFAKNPGLADEVISRNGWADVSQNSDELLEVDALAAQSRKTAFDH